MDAGVIWGGLPALCSRSAGDAGWMGKEGRGASVCVTGTRRAKGWEGRKQPRLTCHGEEEIHRAGSFCPSRGAAAAPDCQGDRQSLCGKGKGQRDREFECMASQEEARGVMTMVSLGNLAVLGCVGAWLPAFCPASLLPPALPSRPTNSHARHAWSLWVRWWGCWCCEARRSRVAHHDVACRIASPPTQFLPLPICHL
jgi:hypothetical protein